MEHDSWNIGCDLLTRSIVFGCPFLFEFGVKQHPAA